MRDARRFGLDQASIEALKRRLDGASDEGQGGLWPHNAETVAAFLACQTQWRVVALSGAFAPARLLFVGLDYTAARAGIEAAGLALTPEIFAGLQVMEAAAREALNGVSSG